MTIEEQKVLTDRLDRASQLYYKGELTEFSDIDFDLKLKELQRAEKENKIIYPNSPTQRVGTDAEDCFKKIQHPRPMLTIENTYDNNGLKEWVDKMYEKYGVKNYNISLKYDGVSCELHYKDGVLMDASTRGDKNVGDDITKNVRTIKTVPLSISIKDDTRVRGEILLPKSRLSEINEERISSGEQPFANTRNACSGSIKQLDSRITAKRGLIFRAWDCYTMEDNDYYNTMTEKGYFLQGLGFFYDEYTLPFCASYEQIIDYVQRFKSRIDGLNLDYDYDGVVVKVDDLGIQNEIGTKDTRAIEWGIARKWNEEYEVWTELQGIEWQVGRTGVVTPVGLLEPVECAGVTISNVTLHNAGFVEESDLHSGNDLRITRSGGVIPYVLEVKHDILMEMNNAHPKFNIPETCPVCGEKLVREGPLLKCINDDCPAIIEGKILQFCSKDCCDIRTIGESAVHDLVEKWLITNIISILEIGGAITSEEKREVFKQHWIKTLGEGYGEKSVDNMLNAIDNARRNISFERILGGLSIPNVGKVMARVLAKKYKNVNNLINCTVEDLVTIDGIAETTAQGIYDWINKKGGYKILSSIEIYGWNYSIPEENEEVNNSTNKPLEGLKVCFTGKSFKFKGDDVEKFLEDNGAKCVSVSKSLNYLITGEKPGGSKVEKAKSLNVEIITEEEFYKKFGI